MLKFCEKNTQLRWDSYPLKEQVLCPNVLTKFTVRDWSISAMNQSQSLNSVKNSVPESVLYRYNCSLFAIALSTPFGMPIGMVGNGVEPESTTEANSHFNPIGRIRDLISNILPWMTRIKVFFWMCDCLNFLKKSLLLNNFSLWTCELNKNKQVT